MTLLTATWPSLHNVGTLSTTREGGVSKPPFTSLNLGLHVGDNEHDVLKNRSLLNACLPKSKPIVWLNQIHSARVLNVDEQFDFTSLHDADALYTQSLNQPLAIMTADCLPILLANDDGTEVAAIHGGWRSLEQGIIKNTIACFNANSASINAWLGPAIGPNQFEVGADVFALFKAQNPLFKTAFKAHGNQKYLANIYKIAGLLLSQLGIKKITGAVHCTVSQPTQFFSYRRDRKTGRMASLIWRK